MTYLKTLMLHAGIALLLIFVRFDRTRRWLRARALSKTRKRINDPNQVAAIISRTSRWIPGANCLTEALCCQAILLRNGFDAKMVLGLERQANSKLEAHAWIELDDAVIIGDNGKLDTYKTMKHRRD